MDISPWIILVVVGVLLIALPLIIKNLGTAAGAHGGADMGFEARLKPGEVLVEPEFDPDAAFANYMRKREAGLVGDVSVDADDAASQMSTHPTSFGRKAI
ncbi:MAG: hypothetical protein JNN10_08260 [Sphingopyxis sp.]|uniref:hypothetical protein n=1 Tax=Sphingopyxis sp. TaxID=1908224 RepID=UPI001A5A6C9B|nr:hypothetical protein [Sphingopyxis sp.]MBL9066271.1 hypothetical protein [Sphingopyxis sp.]